MRRYGYIILFVLTLISASAQDIHFSQFWMQPLYLNPANAGMFDGQYRAGAMYRQQWRAVPVPYRTVSIMGDARFDNVIRGKADGGAGIIFNNDVSGDSKYTINQAYIPVSAVKTISSDSALSVSAGLAPGISNIAFRTDKLTFDKQWDGDIYNPSLSTGENFPSLSRTYFDVSAGITLQYKFKGTGLVSAGTSLSHFNRPRVSFFKNDDVKLYAKTNTFVSVQYPVQQMLFVNVDLMYEKQGPFRETVIAARGRYVMDPKDNIVLSAGFSARPGDAMIVLLGMDYQNYQFGFAYDMNYSKFNVATNKRGAIEFGVIYIFKKPTVFIPKERVCPIYM